MHRLTNCIAAALVLRITTTTAAFNGLPDQVHNQVLSRLTDILEGRDESSEFARLTSDVRRDILQILRDTMPEFKSILVAQKSRRTFQKSLQ